MSVKLAILQDNEQVISEIKELVDDGKPVGYLLKNPHKVVINQPFLVEKVDNNEKKKRWSTGRQLNFYFLLFSK